jgi:hypothetical protein
MGNKKAIVCTLNPMKRSCKHIDIKDVDTILPFVRDCCLRHKKRYDFRKLFTDYGMSEYEYEIAIEEQDNSKFLPYIRNIAEYAASCIRNRNLELVPVKIRQQADKSTGKMRQIGWESAIQQVFDYIAVYSSMDIFRRRITPQQFSSIKGRGQIYGVQMIKEKLKSDYNAARYAKRHGKRYARKCKHFVKLDIKECFPSGDPKLFLILFRRDCANEDILWLWQELLATYRVNGYTGFMIGSLPSQWACQYLISFICRHASENGKVTFSGYFMDDIVLFSTNKRKLRKVVLDLIQYTQGCLRWRIKPNWHIKDIDREPLDMMGYTFYENGKTAIRGRNYIRSRRLMDKVKSGSGISLRQAKRMASYKGFYKFSDCVKIDHEYHVKKLFTRVEQIISNHARKENKIESILFARGSYRTATYKLSAAC